MGKNRLLIIDDEKSFADFLSKVGKSVGFECITTEKIDEFRQSLKDFNPSLVIVDLNMPDMDGVEVLREIRTTEFAGKILIASGLDSKTLETSERLGKEFGLDMAGTIAKPIRAAELRDVLEANLSTSFETNRDTLRRAIENDELFLVYQPKIELETMRVLGTEALLRWQTSTGEIIKPDDFIPIAESMGLIDDLTALVIDKGVQQISEWFRQGLNMSLSLNLSAKNLHDLKLPDNIYAICQEAEVAPESLILEITETAAMQDAATIMDILTRFRIKGFKLSIDDFGTGYSSLVQLQRLPFSELKIDKAFVSDKVQIPLIPLFIRNRHASNLDAFKGFSGQGLFNPITDAAVTI